MTLNLDHIEAVARAAQESRPGAWTKGGCHDDEDPRSVYAWDMPDEISNMFVGAGETMPIAEYIATCFPDVVLALVARVRELTLTDEEKSALRYFADDNDNIHETALALDVIARLTEP